jgi:hypothetical protein
MNPVLSFIVVVAVGAAVFFTLRRLSGPANVPAGAEEQLSGKDFVEAANATSKAARQSLAAGLDWRAR